MVTTASSHRLLTTNNAVLRLDEMTGTWVVFASGRSDRPKQTVDASLKIPLSTVPAFEKECPFCAGNEHMTPNVLLEINDKMHVVANKFPAVSPLQEEGTTPNLHHHHHHHGNQASLDQHVVNNEAPAVGFHEVVIESPFHNAHLACQEEMARDLLTAFRDRGLAHRD